MKDPARLSPERIKNTPPAQHDIWLADSDGSRTTGRLLLRISPKGVRRFYFRYTEGGARMTVPLGKYSHIAKPQHLTLSQARALYLKLASGVCSRASQQLLNALQVQSAGESKPATAPRYLAEPAAKPVETKDAPRRNKLTLLQLCLSYVHWQEEQNKSFANDARIIVKNYIEPSPLAGMAADSVTPQQIASLLRTVVEANKGRTASKIRSVMHAAYARAIGAELDPAKPAILADFALEKNPVTLVRSLKNFSKPRRRNLNQQEQQHVWTRMQPAGPDDENVPLRALRLGFLLAGQRCEQLLRVPVTDVDLDLQVIRLLDGKGAREKPRIHVLPLCPMALGETRWLVEHSAAIGSSFLFASTVAGKHVDPCSVSKLVTEMRKELMAADLVKSHFQFSDLRRTAETTLASLGVSKDVRAQLLSHGLGGIQVQHYDMYEYLHEKRQALAIWEGYLSKLGDVIGE